LIVHAAFAEADAPPETALEFAQELRVLATWLELERIEVGARGDLARPLKRALKAVP
jgi:uncharacterized protein YcaQ